MPFTGSMPSTVAMPERKNSNGKQPPQRFTASKSETKTAGKVATFQMIREQNAELLVAWAADRLGAQMSFETFTANVDDLWFPAMDDIICVLHSGNQLMVLVLDHEEVITLSSIKPKPAM
jgi:hypothetical protein